MTAGSQGNTFYLFGGIDNTSHEPSNKLYTMFVTSGLKDSKDPLTW